MHIDVYLQPPPARRYSSAPKRPHVSQDFLYTGDSFVFTQPRQTQPIVREHAAEGFWAWLSHLFG